MKRRFSCCVMGNFLRMVLKSSQSGLANSVGRPCLAIWKNAPSATRPSQSWIFDLFKCGTCHLMWPRRRCSGTLVSAKILHVLCSVCTGFSQLCPACQFCFCALEISQGIEWKFDSCLAFPELHFRACKMKGFRKRLEAHLQSSHLWAPNW